MTMETITNVIQTQDFNGWTNSGNGKISGTTYTYGAGDGTLTANYTANSVTLPTPTKAGYTFDWMVYITQTEETK